MAAMMSAVAVSARVAPAASGKKMSARSSAFSAALPKASKRASASVVSRGVVRVVAEVDEPIVKIGTRGRYAPTPKEQRALCMRTRGMTSVHEDERNRAHAPWHFSPEADGLGEISVYPVHTR
jgi:hypothetical protein